MAKIIKAVDWIAENLNIYEQINRTDVSQNSVEHRWNPLGIQQEGTNINAELTYLGFGKCDFYLDYFQFVK